MGEYYREQIAQIFGHYPGQKIDLIALNFEMRARRAHVWVIERKKNYSLKMRKMSPFHTISEGSFDVLRVQHHPLQRFHEKIATLHSLISPYKLEM